MASDVHKNCSLSFNEEAQRKKQHNAITLTTFRRTMMKFLKETFVYGNYLQNTWHTKHLPFVNSSLSRFRFVVVFCNHILIIIRNVKECFVRCYERENVQVNDKWRFTGAKIIILFKMINHQNNNDKYETYDLFYDNVE